MSCSWASLAQPHACGRRAAAAARAPLPGWAMPGRRAAVERFMPGC